VAGGSTLEDQGDRAGIGEGYFHHGLKLAGLGFGNKIVDNGHKPIIHLLGFRLRFILPSLSLKIRRSTIFRAIQSNSFSVSFLEIATSARIPFPMRATFWPPTATSAWLTLWTTAFINQFSGDFPKRSIESDFS
jgi:hypothetical protein